jgi:hypothetical protein
MRKDKNNRYIYAKAKDNPNSGVPQTVRTGTNEITMYYDDFYKLIHETRHGGQIARGEFDINVKGNVIKGSFGVSKEIDAYRAQYSYDGIIEYVPMITSETVDKELNVYCRLSQEVRKSTPIDVYIKKKYKRELNDINSVNKALINLIVRNYS